MQALYASNQFTMSNGYVLQKHPDYNDPELKCEVVDSSK